MKRQSRRPGGASNPALTGPAAYHEAKREQELADLRARVESLRAALAQRITLEELRDGVKRAYQAGHADGYHAGAVDALNPMSPDHFKALACLGPDLP